MVSDVEQLHLLPNSINSKASGEVEGGVFITFQALNSLVGVKIPMKDILTHNARYCYFEGEKCSLDTS